MKRILILLLAICIGACTNQIKEKITGQLAESAMVVSAHPLASKVGVDILKKGGNAVDAAIATQFALAVVHPVAGNIGGGGFMVLRMASDSSATLDYREKAPAAATPTMYIGETGELVEGLSTEGHLASGIPGTVAGLAEAHAKFSKLPWKDLVQPAIDLARNGFPLTKKEASGLNELQKDLVRLNTVSPDFLLKEEWKEGDIIHWLDLANTLERIRDNGKAGFYEGKTADDLVAEMTRGKGIITHDDLKNYQAVWRKPVTGFYKGYKIISMPPPSSGGIALMQLLKSVEPFPITGLEVAADECDEWIIPDPAHFIGQKVWIITPDSPPDGWQEKRIFGIELYAPRWKHGSLMAAPLWYYGVKALNGQGDIKWLTEDEITQHPQACDFESDHF